MTTNFLGNGPVADRTGAWVSTLFTKFAAPAAVKSAPDADLTNFAPVAVNFADRDRSYPVHTPKAAWASAACYHATGSDHPQVANRIKEACDRHRLFGEWDRLAARARPTDPPPAEHYALPGAGKYPLDTADQVKAASEYFTKYADQFDPGDRRDFAANTAAASNRFPGVVPAAAVDILEAEGGLGRLAPGWKRAFDDRVKMAELDGQADLAEALKEASASPPPDTSIAAAALREVDRRNGWKMDDPISVMVCDTPSAAQAKMAKVAQAADGSWYDREAIATVPDATVATLFDSPMVVSTATRAELLASPTKSAAFRTVLADHGIYPIEAAPRAAVDWAALAATLDLAGGSGK